MNTPSAPNQEFADIPLLVRQSANEIVAAVPEHAELRYPLGHLASALAITEGTEAAHTFASDAIANLRVHPDATAGVWADLYKAGDEAALPKARQAAGLTSGEQAALLDERMPRWGIAPLIVGLAEAGDKGAIEIAQDTTKAALIRERVALFGRLYKSGDTASLDLAIEAAKEAKRDSEQTGGHHYHRSEQALTDMAEFAAQNGQPADALKLITHIDRASSKALVHVQLFRHGRDESLQAVLAYLGQPVDNSNEPRYVERKLAEAGYAPAIQNLKQRIARGKKYYADTTAFLNDLAVLHVAGDETAAATLAEAVRSEREPEYYLYHLGRVGLTRLQLEMATDLYNKNPSGENAERMLEARHDNAKWQEVFNHWLHERNNVLRASSLVIALASRLQVNRE